MFAAFAVHIGKRAGMATHATLRERGVIDLGTQPRCDGMATFARQCRRQMQGRALSARCDSVMAIGARAQRLRVIEFQRVLEGGGLDLVASLAGVGGGQALIVATAKSGGANTVMTIDTTAGY